jgi:hypothetical protein
MNERINAFHPTELIKKFTDSEKAEIREAFQAGMEYQASLELAQAATESYEGREA